MSVGERVRLLLIVNPELDTEMLMFLPSVRTVSNPSRSILLHEIEGRGNPSAEHVNMAGSGATTVTFSGGVVMSTCRGINQSKTLFKQD